MEKKISIIAVEMIIVSILLYLSGHYLKLIFKMAGQEDYKLLLFGINIYCFIVDVCIYSSIIILLVVIGIIIYEVDSCGNS